MRYTKLKLQTTGTKKSTSDVADRERLPLAGLLALAMTGFLALLTETVPAGMLSQISQDLSVSESLAGQFVTLYAMGALLTAIPLITATQSWPRRRLLLVTLTSLLIFNTLTALTSSYGLALGARFLAGMASGLLWGMLAGYARRMVSDSLKGRALTIAGLGAPIALSLGVPLGAYLGTEMGWRMTFGSISLLTLGVILWVRLGVPDYAGQTTEKRQSIFNVFLTPGVRSVLAVLVLWVLAHNILYTYVMPFLVPAGLSARVDTVLLIFGVASVVGIWLTGLLIDRVLRLLVLISLALFALASLALGLGGTLPEVVYVAVAVWGLTFGGAAALLQTASANAAGFGADIAQSILVTVWNLAIAVGGIIGGILLDKYGASSFPWSLLVLVVIALIIAWSAKTHGFPAEIICK